MLLTALVVLAAAASPPQRPSSAFDPPLDGRRIEAKDGDTVVIPGKARVRILYRNEARIRAIHNGAQRWIVVLVDYVDPQRGAPDGIVDADYSFHGVEGMWPLGDRWEGSAVLDDYSMGQPSEAGLGITTEAGLVQLLRPGSSLRWFLETRGTVVSFNGSGRGGLGRYAFDQAEARAVAQAERAEDQRAGRAPMPMSLATPADPPPQGTARVGSRIVTPVKIIDVPPVKPAEAARARVRGVVLVEITIGTDGSVTDAKILRSIALLDHAALEAVRQWRYEPTLLEGRPVPIILVVAVPFE